MKTTHKLIGLFGSCLHEQNQMNFLSALREACIKTGYTTIAFSASHSSIDDAESAAGELKLLELFKYIHLDCIIILTETIGSQDLINKLVEIGHEKNIPVFSIDGVVEGCYNMPLDYQNGFRDIVKHVIIDHKVTKVNMLAGFRGNTFSDERIEIYKEVLAENDIVFEEERLGYGDFWDRPTRVATKKFLDSDLEMPEAIICANDTMAIVASTMLAEHGYNVPEDIIVTGFDGTQASMYNSPTITTCTPDYAEAMDFIMQEIEIIKDTGKVIPCDHMIGYKILKRQSCGCEPKTVQDYREIIATLYDATGDSSWHTLAMNTLVTNLLDKQSVEDIATLLPDNARLWSQHFRFACIKSELTRGQITRERCADTTDDFRDMTTLLYLKDQEFDESLRHFHVSSFIPDFDDLVPRPGNTFVVRLIHYGRQVFGYTVDEIEEPTLRNLQRCNEFDMFLAHSINTVLHNFALNELNRNLEKAYEEITALSIHDPMTGTYNRRGFYSMLNSKLREEQNKDKYLYIVFIDLDGLKGINDNFGHKEGDFAITTVAHALRDVDIDSSLCSRFGGDEFICAFFADIPDNYTSESIKQQVKDNIAKTPGVKEKRYPIDFSIGVLCQVVNKISNVDDIILSTDKIMYIDKLKKKNLS